jgi:type I restriction enzyme, S subunit
LLLKCDKTVRKNDIILARSGEGTIGKVALIEDEKLKGIFADFTMRIRLKDYNPEFAYYYFRTTYFQYLIEVYKKGLGNNTNIFPIVIREFPLIDIPLPEQYRIVSEIHAEIDKQKNLKAAISDMQQQIDQIVEDSIS